MDQRDMEGYEDYLVEQWQDDSGDRKGYRQLATWLNVTMLRREMDRAGMMALGGEAESKYDRLTSSNDVVAEEVKDDLTAGGVDAESLLGDFVSYGVVRTHLKQCLGAERSEEDTESDWETKTLEISRDHAHSKVMEAISALRNKGELEMPEDIELHVVFELECSNCHTKIPAERAIRRGDVCHCGNTGDESTTGETQTS